VADEVRRYIVRLVKATRESKLLVLGAGPRASIGLLRMASAMAILGARDFVTVEDVKAVAYPVMSHRLVEAQGEISPARPHVVADIVASVPSPI
jgi:MoxR-like ATPase